MQKEILNLENTIDESDPNNYNSELSGLYDVAERNDRVLINVRQILLCSIFSYYEAMINELSKYYIVTEKKTVKEITKSIKQEYKNRYKRELSVKQDDWDFLNDHLRVLRNYYNHGTLSINNKEKLKLIISSQNNELKYDNENNIYIDNNNFLLNSLNRVRAVLVGIDDNFNSKR